MGEKKFSIIAISGMPGAGKSSVSDKLREEIPNLTYFDFGAFFRPITFYLVKSGKMTVDDLRQIINQSRVDELMKHLNLGYRKTNGICEISVRNHFFSPKELYTPEMNKLTVDVGGTFGDSLNSYINEIVEQIRQESPVLLNARRPFAVCNDISNHIFLKANFFRRAERKAELEATSIGEARERLRLRDEKESAAGFWNTYPFTEIIDTTDRTTEETTELVKKHILSHTITEKDRREGKEGVSK